MMKKKWMPLLAMIAASALIFGGCQKPDTPVDNGSDGDGGAGGDDTVTYTLTVSTETLTLDDDGDNYFTVTTNGTFTVEVDDEDVCTAEAEDGTVTVTGVKAGSTYITVSSVENTNLTKTVNVTVNATKMTLTVDYSALTAAADVASVGVKYGHEVNDGDNIVQDATVTLDAANKKATAVLEKKYANTYEFFNGIAITLKDADDNELEAKWTNSLEATDSINNGSNWFKFNTSGVTLTASDKVEVSANLVITLSGFTGVDKVTVACQGADTVTADAVEATLNEDKTTATVSVSSLATKDDGYFNTLIKVLDAEGNELTFNVVNSWLKFDSNGMTLTLTKIDESEVWVKMLDAQSVTGSNSFQLLVNATSFEGLSIKKLKIEVANAADIWWAAICSSAEESNKIEFKSSWSDAISGYFTEITDATTIAAYVAGGIYYAGATGNITVSYVAN